MSPKNVSVADVASAISAGNPATPSGRTSSEERHDNGAQRGGWYGNSSLLKDGPPTITTTNIRHVLGELEDMRDQGVLLRGSFCAKVVSLLPEEKQKFLYHLRAVKNNDWDSLKKYLLKAYNAEKDLSKVDEQIEEIMSQPDDNANIVDKLNYLSIVLEDAERMDDEDRKKKFKDALPKDRDLHPVLLIYDGLPFTEFATKMTDMVRNLVKLRTANQETTAPKMPKVTEAVPALYTPLKLVNEAPSPVPSRTDSVDSLTNYLGQLTLASYVNQGGQDLKPLVSNVPAAMAAAQLTAAQMASAQRASAPMTANMMTRNLPVERTPYCVYCTSREHFKSSCQMLTEDLRAKKVCIIDRK
ncbi:hypothetical protein GQ54DRAFT_314728, partial [Martensiomyces pterosporus]